MYFIWILGALKETDNFKNSLKQVRLFYMLICISFFNLNSRLKDKITQKLSIFLDICFFSIARKSASTSSILSFDDCICHHLRLCVTTSNPLVNSHRMVMWLYIYIYIYCREEDTTWISDWLFAHMADDGFEWSSWVHEWIRPRVWWWWFRMWWFD